MASSLTALLNTIILLGIVQGFIMSGLLFFSKKQRYANRLLSALILLITLASFNLYGSYQNWFGSAWLAFLSVLIPLVVIMPIGPLMYFYVQAVLDPSFTIQKKQRLHFLPVIIDFVPSLTVIVFLTGLGFHFFKNTPAPWGNFIDTYNVYADIPRWASITLYVLLSYRQLTVAKVKAAKNGSNPGIKWLQQFLRVMLLFQCTWFVFLIPYVIPEYSNKLLDAVDWYPVYIPMAVMVYYLGIKGYVVSHTATAAQKAQAAQATLSNTVVEQTAVLLEKAMEEDRLYLDPTLNLDAVAQHLHLAPKTISAVLNQHIYKSFNEFINGYRVEAFKEKLLQPENENLTIAGIATDCGFNSQATFQRTFKQVTGMSPSQFRKSELQAN
ncbi:MAG TPA: helix-turn-helix domain-containing protein [Chitinophagaceae bacterium]|nr:helix-turn-helix domain-containing protein [Chitinophagaceae bacterium]